MKNRLGLIFATLLISLGASAQSLVGTWSGELKVSSQMSLKLVLHINDDNTVAMDSPDQGAYGIPGETVYLSADSINMKIPRLMMSYSGHLVDNRIEGIFKQGGMSLPLSLIHQKANRPQTPKPPFPYTTEDVTVNNTTDVSLAGTLTMPENAGNQPPVVVLVTGSGMQNRDEEIFGHKPFAVIADYLARNGIASLRYDDRGGFESAGSRDHATTGDYASDAQAVIDYIKSTGRFGKVGLIGHSEGGMIAYMLGAKGRNLDFIISIAGPAVKGTKTSGFQNKVLALTQGVPEAEAEQFGVAVEKAFEYKLQNGALSAPSEDVLLSVYPQSEENEITRALSQSLSNILCDASHNDWIDFYFRYDPADDMTNIKIPAFLIYGEKDSQVPPTLNVPTATATLPHAQIKVYPSLNHMMQHATTGQVNEYQSIEETISPDVLEDIAGFIKSVQ